MHALRDCDEVRDFWDQIIHPDHWSRFFSLGLYAWLDWNMHTDHIGTTDYSWPTIFGVAILVLWWDRNSLVFSQRLDIKETLRHMVLSHVKLI